MKRELQGLATREKLLDSAERLFFERGVVSTTLEDIARASGMTRGAIYGHFTNKWSLVSALFERSQLPLDPFTVSGVEASASIDALRVELERRFGGDPLPRTVKQLNFDRADVLQVERLCELSTVGRRVAYHDHDAGRRWATR